MNVLTHVVFVVFVLLLITMGALQCFAPETHKRIHLRLVRSVNPESPGGKLMLYSGKRMPNVISRVSGFLLMVVGIVVLLGYLRFFR